MAPQEIAQEIELKRHWAGIHLFGGYMTVTFVLPFFIDFPWPGDPIRLPGDIAALAIATIVSVTWRQLDKPSSRLPHCGELP